VVPGANLGADCAVFEAVHGTAPDIAGQDVANPTALLMSALLMLEHIGEADAAARIRAALHTVLRDGRSVTPDLGGSASTTGFAEAIVAALPA
jgi:isocitrate dehydrogenase (NAD+)